MDRSKSGLSQRSSRLELPLSSPPTSFSDRKKHPHRRDGGLTTRLLSQLSRRRPLACIFFLLLVFWAWCRYELHVELQLYRRGWVRDAVERTRPLSGTCQFTDAYTTPRPSFVDPAPGLAMRHGGDCYSFSGLIPREPVAGMEIPDHVYVHLYWRADLRPLGPREILTLESILVSQPDSFQVVLWTAGEGNVVDKSPLMGALVNKYPVRLSVRALDMHALAVGTPLEGSDRLSALTDKLAYLDGDVARLLLLWNYGGIWIDMDYIVLRRLDVLLENEWVQQWDCYDKPYQPLNGAMMHFRQHSPYMCEMIHIIATDPPPRPLSTDWGSLVYQKLWRRLVENGIRPFKILPFCFTDGRSCRLDNRLPDPFAADPRYDPTKWEQLQQRLDSVFAIHLHNQWEKTFPKGGWMDRYVVSKIKENSL